MAGAMWVFLQFGILLLSGKKDNPTWVEPSARTHKRIELTLHRCIAPLNDNLRLWMWIPCQTRTTLTLFTTEKRIIRVVDTSSDQSDCSRWLMSSSPSVSACSVAVDQRNYTVYFCLLPNLECCVFVFSLNVLLSVGRENIARQKICTPKNILMSSGGCQQVGAHWGRLYPREKFYGSSVSFYLRLFRSLLMEPNWIKQS